MDAAHAAKFGMDNSNGTVWISASPVNGGHGQWIARAFPAPVTVVAYSIGYAATRRSSTQYRLRLRPALCRRH